MTFNPATFGFVDTTHASAKQVQRLGHADEADYSRHAQTKLVDPLIARFIQGLEQAAARFAVRRDDFARGKEATCLDIAAKLNRFGSFASDNQMAFAYKLIGWSAGYGKPHPFDAAQEAPQAALQQPVAPVVAPTPAPAPVVRLERLFALMQRLSKLTIGAVVIARKNQDSLCWVKMDGFDGVVGKIEHGVLSLFKARLPGCADKLLAELLKIEADPEAAAALHGKLSGRCSICSRDLTDPVSIERGIGPICIGKAGW